MSKQLPSGWTRTTLGRGVEIICGQHVLAKNYSRSKGTIPYLTGPSDFDNGYIHASRFVEASGVLCKKGDILLTVKGSGVGTLALADQCYCISRQLMALRPFLWEPRFVLHTLEYTTEQINQMSAGTIPGITKPQVENWSLLLPPLPEQRRIVEILDEADAAVRATEDLIKAKTKYKNALAEQLLTGKLRFPEFKGKAWREVRLEQYAKKEKGSTVSLNSNGDGVPYIGSTSFTGIFGLYTTDKQGVHCMENDILVLWDGEYAGKVTTGLRGVASSTVAVLRVQEELHPACLFQKMHTDNRRIRGITEGSGIPHLPGDFLEWYTFQLPSLAEQRRIADVLDLIDQEIELLKRQWKAQKKQKEGLMQKLLTGEVRVKHCADSGAAEGSCATGES